MFCLCDCHFLPLHITSTSFPHATIKALNYEMISGPIHHTNRGAYWSPPTPPSCFLPPGASTALPHIPTCVPINSALPSPSPGCYCILFVPIRLCTSPFSYGMGFCPSCCWTSVLRMDASSCVCVCVWRQEALIRVLKSQT